MLFNAMVTQVLLYAVEVWGRTISLNALNEIGNNDGMNISAPQNFSSKQISKINVVDDMVSSNVIYG